MSAVSDDGPFPCKGRGDDQKPLGSATPPISHLSQALKDVHAIVPPLWPLADYVAVNPCVGLDRPAVARCSIRC